MKTIAILTAILALTLPACDTPVKFGYSGQAADHYLNIAYSSKDGWNGSAEKMPDDGK